MNVPLRLLAGCAVLALALLVLRSLPVAAPVVLDGAATGSQDAPRSELADLPVPPAQRQVQAASEAQSAAETSEFSAIPEHADLVSAQALVRGRVVDVAGEPVAGLTVRAKQPDGTMGETGAVVIGRTLATTTADAAGRFELKAPKPLVLSAANERYTTLFECTMRFATDKEAVIVVAERIPLGGIVVDDVGVPLPNVRVSVVNVDSPSMNDVDPFDGVVLESSTDRAGVFSVEGAAQVASTEIQFRLAGLAPLVLPVPEGGDPAMTVVMSRDEDDLYTIQGRVLLEDESPAIGAFVSTGNMASPVDDNGFFVIDFEAWLKHAVDESLPTTLTAVRAGLMPVSIELPSVLEARESGWPEGLVIVLREETLTLRGVVVDTEGNPLAGVLVEPVDMTFFGYVPVAGLPAFSGSPKAIEQLAGGGEALTGPDGRFALAGLSDRTYSISALLRDSLVYGVSKPLHASEQHARIELDKGALGTIAGRIVDRHGKGIGDVRVSASRKRVSELMIGPRAKTDPDGRFSISNVTTSPEFLRIEGEAVVPELFRELGVGDDVTDLELAVGRRCRVRFDWGAWPGASDALTVVDENDSALMMMRVGDRGVGEVPSVPFQQGVTEVLVIPDTATHAVVSRDGNEVTRIPLDFPAGVSAEQVTVVRL